MKILQYNYNRNLLDANIAYFDVMTRLLRQ